MRILVLLALSFASLLLESAVACVEDRPVLTTTKNDGTRIGIFLSRSTVEQTAPWRPEDGEPPLSISTAYTIVKDWAHSKYSRYDGIQIREITLRSYGCSLSPNRWYYIFDISPVIDGNTLFGSGNWAIVLFDGTVVGPRKY